MFACAPIMYTIYTHTRAKEKKNNTKQKPTPNVLDSFSFYSPSPSTFFSHPMKSLNKRFNTVHHLWMWFSGKNFTQCSCRVILHSYNYLICLTKCSRSPAQGIYQYTYMYSCAHSSSGSMAMYHSERTTEQALWYLQNYSMSLFALN